MRTSLTFKLNHFPYYKDVWFFSLIPLKEVHSSLLTAQNDIYGYLDSCIQHIGEIKSWWLIFTFLVQLTCRHHSFFSNMLHLCCTLLIRRIKKKTVEILRISGESTESERQSENHQWLSCLTVQLSHLPPKVSNSLETCEIGSTLIYSSYGMHVKVQTLPSYYSNTDVYLESNHHNHNKAHIETSLFDLTKTIMHNALSIMQGVAKTKSCCSFSKEDCCQYDNRPDIASPSWWH